MAIQAKTPLRVVQWATGNVGLRSLRAIIEHPAMELAGVYVHAAAKAGQDAGTLPPPAFSPPRISRPSSP